MKAKTYFKHDVFTDVEGKSHMITLAAHLEPFEEFDQTIVSFGVSVCNPEDKPDKKIGEAIAEGRAKKFNTSLGFITGSKGMISVALINLMLERQMEFIKKEPKLYYRGKKELLKKKNE